MKLRRFALSLVSGRMQLKDLDSDSRNGRPLCDDEYDMVQSAAEKAFSHIAHQTGRTEGGEPDEAKMVKDINDKLLQLDLLGHPREIAVARLHFHVRYGIAIDQSVVTDTAEGGLNLKPIEDATDVYSTFCFDSERRPLEAMQNKLGQWMQLANAEPRTQTKAKENHPKWQEILGLGGVESKPLRVVITGVTGAGKSTFINGLLGKDIVPTASKTCTAAVLHLRYASEADKECIKVYWRSPEDLRELEQDLQKKKGDLGRCVSGSDGDGGKTWIEKLKSQGKRTGSKIAISSSDVDKIEKELLDCKQRLTSLERSRQYWEKGEVTFEELSKLNDFAKVGSDCLAEATSKIEVFIKHPLLKLVEIVDAPGLRDGSDERQKTLLRAFEGDTAWLYLVPATVRTNSPQEDWEYIQRFVNNQSSILVLTKAETQPPDKEFTLPETMQSRVRDYFELLEWKRPAVWCSALLTSKMGAVPAVEIEDNIERDEFRSLTDLLEYPKRRCKERYENYLKEFAARNPESLQVARDYIFDSSRLPYVMRRIGTVLFEDAIEVKVRRGRDEMIAAAKEAIQACEESIQSARRILRSHDVILTKRKELSETQSVLAVLETQLEAFKSKSQTAADSINSRCSNTAKEFNKKIESIEELLREDFIKKYDKEMNLCIWGGFKYEVHNHFVTKNLSDFTAKTLQVSEGELLKILNTVFQQPAGNLGMLACQWSFTEKKTVEIGESAFEWAQDAKERNWRAVSKEGRIFKDKLGKKFSETVEGMGGRAKGVLDAEQGDLERKIEAYKHLEISIQTEIRENDPQETRRMAEHNLAFYEQQQSAFKIFLQDLKFSGPNS